MSEILYTILIDYAMPIFVMALMVLVVIMIIQEIRTWW